MISDVHYAYNPNATPPLPQSSSLHPQPHLIPKRLNIINLLHSLCSQHKRMLLLHTNAIFDADAHTAEVDWVSFGVGNVEAACDEKGSAEVLCQMGGNEVRSLRFNSDALPWLQFRLARLLWSVVDV